MFLSKCKYSGC